jgi:hypothetical protein
MIVIVDLINLIRYDCYCPALLYFVWYLKQTPDKVIWKYLIAIHFITFCEHNELFYSISVMLTYADIYCCFLCIADEIRIRDKMV